MKPDWITHLLRAAEYDKTFDISMFADHTTSEDWPVVCGQACLLAAQNQQWNTVKQLTPWADCCVQDFAILRYALRHQQWALVASLSKRVPNGFDRSMWQTLSPSVIHFDHAPTFRMLFNRFKMPSSTMFSVFIDALTKKSFGCVQVLDETNSQLETMAQEYITTLQNRNTISSAASSLGGNLEEFRAWKQRERLLEHVQQSSTAPRRKI